MEKQKTCKELINSHYQSRIETLRELWSKEDRQEFYEFGLCLDYVAPHTFNEQPRGYIRYQLSWGGPSDEFRFYLDENRMPVEVRYHYMDWFDGASKKVTGAALDLMLQIFSDWHECETIDHLIAQAKE